MLRNIFVPSVSNDDTYIYIFIYIRRFHVLTGFLYELYIFPIMAVSSDQTFKQKFQTKSKFD